MPQRGTPTAQPRYYSSVDTTKLQGPDYFNYVLQNDPDPAKRAGAQQWLNRYYGSTGTGGGTSPAGTTQNQKIDPSVHGVPNINHPAIQAAIASDPRLKKNLDTLSSSADGQTSIDALITAMTAGDYTGTPFDAKTAQDAIDKYTGMLDPAFKADQMKAGADLGGTLASKKAAYDAYLGNQGIQFKQDKVAADEDAASKGVLFSSGRVQKLNNLSATYNNNANAAKAAYANDVGSLSRDFQYKYGTPAANDSNLSQYYTAGGNSYNAMGGRGAVNSSGISSIYNPSAYNFYGTNNALEKSQAITGAAGLLANKGNKLLGAFGQGYQYGQ